MVCYKLDKIDKIFISFLCIFVTFTCIINCFCLGTENIEIIKKDGLGLSQNTLLSVENNKGYYFETIPGITYKIIFNEPLQYRILELNDKPDLNYSITNGNGKLISNKILNEYTFTAKKEMTYIFAYNNSEFNIDVEILTVGYKATIAQLTYLFNLSFFGDIIEKITPYILVVVTVSLGFYFILHAIKEVSKGRDV